MLKVQGTVMCVLLDSQILRDDDSKRALGPPANLRHCRFNFFRKKNDRADKKMIQTQISNSAIFLIFPITLEKNKEERETFAPHSLISFY